jgi:hypothetical protein
MSARLGAREAGRMKRERMLIAALCGPLSVPDCIGTSTMHDELAGVS